MTDIIQTISQSDISNRSTTNQTGASAASTSLATSANTTSLTANATNSSTSSSSIIVQANTISANNHHQAGGSGGSVNSGGGSGVAAASANNGGGNQETCLICGDVASGKHYGLRSCEACKAFFKRTVQGKIEYSCPATRECEINKRRRKACQACRFQKCLNMGMLKEGVRLDRVRGGRQKYRRGTSPSPGSGVSGRTSCLSDTSLSGNNNTNNSSSATVMGSSNNNHSMNINGSQANSSSILSSSASLNAVAGGSNHLAFPLAGVTSIAATTHPQSAIRTGETTKIMTALINCEPEEPSASLDQHVNNIPANLNVQLKTLYILGDLFDRELVSLIGWAKQIPGFSERITLNDQMRLLQSTWAEVIALSIGYRSHLKRIEIYKQQQLSGGGGGFSGLGNSGLGIHSFMHATSPSPTSSSPASTSSSSYNHNNGTGKSSYNLENTEIRLVFAKDLIMDFKHAILCGAEEIFYNCVQLIKRLDHLKITPKEYILLKAISLTNADVRLENPKATFRLRDLVMDALYEVTLSEYLQTNTGGSGGGSGNSNGQNDFLSSLANIKQEISGNTNGGGSGSSSANMQQFKLEAQERPPSSMNQYASSTSSPTPPSRSSSSIPSSSSTSSISPHSNINNNNSNNIINATTATSLDLGNKRTIINNRMNQVLLCLPVLRQIDSSIRKFWNDIRKGPNNVPMNKLFEEMLEPCQRMYRSSVEM